MKYRKVLIWLLLFGLVRNAAIAADVPATGPAERVFLRKLDDDHDGAKL